jgi:ribosomal protein S18 acetylase RimI-like enzyme
MVDALPDISAIQYREVNSADISSIAKMLSDWETEEYWIRRVSGYLSKELHPQKALLPRVAYVATKQNTIIGFIAGHLTLRFECEGELQWINVTEKYRREGIASELLRLLVKWFIEQKATTICVDVGSENGRQFYVRYGAERLNEHWMIWRDIREMC